MSADDPLLESSEHSDELKALLRRPLPRRAKWGLLASLVLLIAIAIIVFEMRR